MDSAINTQIVSPFDGKPETRQLTSQDGRVIFEIIAKELTPLRAKFANALAWIIALAAAGFGFFTVFQMVDPHGFHIIAFGCGPLIAIPLFEWGIGKLLRKETAMVLTVDEFAFQDSKNWKRFNRQIDHRFSLLPHDKTRDEAEDNEFAVRKAQANGKVIRKKRYYGDSYHLSYEYMGQRNDIAVIYGRKDAMAVLARLKACDTVMNMQAAKGAPVNMKPQDEWADQPGDIPETV